MATVNKDYLKKNPIDFIYAWASEEFLALVKKYISATSASTIRSKKANQLKYLANIYGGYKKINYDEVAGFIEAQYGYTPVTILKKLLKGETVAGKNWREGVYGVSGFTRTDGYSSNSDLTVDGATGAIISRSGAAVGQGTATYDNKGNVTGYSYSVGGKVYTTIYDKSSKRFYANTYGDKDNMYYANGTTYTPATASSVWENIQTAIPMFENFLKWIASLFNFTPLTLEKTVPQQKELSTPQPQESSMGTIGIIACVALGGMLLMKKKK